MLTAAGEPADPPVALFHEAAERIVACCGHRRLKAFRLAFGWTVREAVERAIAVSAHPRGLAERSWLGWEAGAGISREYEDLLCRLFTTGPVQLGLAVDYSPVPFRSAPRLLDQGESARSDGDGLEGLVTMAARRALRFAAMAGGTNLGAESLAEIHDEVGRIAESYLRQPLPILLPDLVEVQDLCFRLLEGRQRPGQASDLYVLAGISSGLLAKASHDLGQPSAAMTQARAAFVCAETGGHAGLQAWVRGLQSLIAYWAGRPREALDYACLGALPAEATNGTVAVWLAALEARAAGFLGEGETAHAAILRAEVLRESVEHDDLDDMGGVLSFNRPRQLYYAAEATAWLDESGSTIRRARDAVRAYELADAQERSFGDEAGARSVLTLGLIGEGELDGAAAAMGPVLDLVPAQRINGVVRSVQRVQSALRAQPTDAQIAVDLRDEIEAFCRTPMATAPH
ncbi:MAG: XRE family transcriptional regulator [Actinomycetales bacterium]|nr:XRE family transcriptional regulator [Actinomycetales bacterium]